MTLGILCLDGLDHRLAAEVDLFRELENIRPDFEWGPLENDLNDRMGLFTPRVWTTIFAGSDNHSVRGWLNTSDWENVMDAHGPTLFWDQFPGTLVHDLAVHKDGHTTEGAAMPDDWTAYVEDPEDLRDCATERARYWNQDVTARPPVLASWFRFPDGWGHVGVARDIPLSDGYQWIRDTLLTRLEVPDELVVLSDHGFVTDTVEADLDENRGRAAHRPSGVVGATGGVSQIRDYGTVTELAQGWRSDVADYLNDRQLDALGYR